MTDPDRPARFLTGSLARHIWVMSLSSAIGFMALFLVDFIDLLFISMLGVQELAAAVGFAGTILFATTSISIGLGIAAGALVARSLGENHPDRAAALLTHILVIGLALSTVLAILICTNLRALTGLVGASGETQQLAISYLAIVIPTMPVMLVGIVTSAALRSHGAAKLAMYATLAAGGVNAVLDPILIFGLGLGLEGAAWATVVARFSMAIAGVAFMIRGYGGFAPISFCAVVRDLRPIVAIAFPAILANIATPIGSAYVTRAMAEFGPGAVAGMAVIGRITPVAFALIFAISGAIGPIIGQNYGAGLHSRIREAFNTSILLIVAYVIPVVVVLYLVRGPIATLFDAQGVSRELIFLFCGPLSLAWIFNGIIFVGNASYNNLGHPFYSAWINWARNTLGIVPFVYVGAQIGGASGVLIGQFVGGAVIAVLSVLLVRRIMVAAETGLKAPRKRGAFAALRDEFRISHFRH